MRSVHQGGFTFNELLVSMGFVAAAVMSYSLSSAHLFRQQLVLDHSAVAIFLAQDKLEQLQAQPQLDESDNCESGGEQGLSGKSGTQGAFARCWRVASWQANTGLKQVDVLVSWRDHESHEIRLTTLVFTGDEG